MTRRAAEVAGSERLVDDLLASPHLRLLGPPLDGRRALYRNARQRMELRGALCPGALDYPSAFNATSLSSVVARALPAICRRAALARERAFNESIIATAFYRFGEVNHDDCIGLREIGFDLADNQIDTLTKAFQATTVACARCHDHKLDAISTQEYYAMLGILRSSRMVSHSIDAPDVNANLTAQLRRLKADLRRELAAVWQSEVPMVNRYLLAAQARQTA